MPLRRTLVLAGVSVLALVASHLPLWHGLERLATQRAGRSSVGASTLWSVLRMQAGSAHAAVALAFAVLVVIGALRARRRAPRLVAYLGTSVALHVAALIAIGPKQSESALVFDRYVLPVTPYLLGAVAVALGTSWSTARAVRLVQPLAVGLALAALFLSGPLSRPSFRRGSFAHHNLLVSFVDGRELPAVAPPESYARLAGPGAILEFPWNPHWNHSLATLAWQRSHGREVVVAGRQITATHPCVALRNAVPIDVDPLASFLASRARWLVVHRDPEVEEERFLARDDVPEDWEELRRDAQAIARAARQSWGPPQLSDESLLVWDLDRAR